MWMEALQRRFLFWAAGILFIGGLVTILWASNKGFDFSDEGYYIAGYSNLLEYNIGITAFHFLVLQTIAKFGSGLIYFRITRLLLTLIACFFLAYALNACNDRYKLISGENSRRNILLLTLIGFAGCLPGYGLGPQTLSYNHLTFIFSTVFTGFLFLMLARSEKQRAIRFYSFFAGIFFGFEFFVKIPTAVFLGILFLIVEFLLIRKQKLKVLSFAFIFTLGVLVSFLLVCLPNSPIRIVSEYLRLITSISKYAAHDIGDVLANYQVGLELLWNEQLSPFVQKVEILFVALVLLVVRKYKWIRVLGAILALADLIWIVNEIHKGKYFGSGVAMYSNASLAYVLLIAILLIMLIVLCTEVIVIKKFVFSPDRIFIFATLFFFPILCSLGTNNFLQIQILFFLSSWFLLAALIMENAVIKQSNISTWVVLVMVVLFYKAGNDLYTGLIKDPYRVKGALTEQTEPLYLHGSDETILIHKDLMKTIHDLAPMMESKSAECLFTSSDLIGLGYVFNKKLIAYGWNDCASLSKNFLCDNYNHSEWAKNKSTLFVMNSSLNACHVLECMFDSTQHIKKMEMSWTNNSADSLFVYSKK